MGNYKTNRNFWLKPPDIVGIGLIAAALYFLIMEHLAHPITTLQYLILLLTPLMHFFMHRGYVHHGSDDHDDDNRPSGMLRSVNAYGLRPLLVLYSEIFLIFAFGFAKPRSQGEQKGAIGEFRDRYSVCIARTLSFSPSWNSKATTQR